MGPMGTESVAPRGRPPHEGDSDRSAGVPEAACAPAVSDDAARVDHRARRGGRICRRSGRGPPPPAGSLGGGGGARGGRRQARPRGRPPPPRGGSGGGGGGGGRWTQGAPGGPTATTPRAFWRRRRG